MAQEEIFGSRNMDYSAWHRRLSLCRFIGIEAAQTAAMIDLDAAIYLEYDDQSKKVLVIVETAVDRNQWKPASVIKSLAEQASVPAIVVLYKSSTTVLNPADTRRYDIEKFRYRRVWPNEVRTWTIQTPDAFAKMLIELRQYSAKRIDTRISADAQIATLREQIAKLEIENRLLTQSAIKPNGVGIDADNGPPFNGSDYAGP